VCVDGKNFKLTKTRQKRVEELEKRLKSMEEQLQRATETKAVVKVVDEREALDHLLEEGLSNFECRVSLASSKIPDIRSSGMFTPVITRLANFNQL
jgi:aspartate aminotransferase-like enzyme